MKLSYYIYSLIASVLLIFSACSPDEYDLGGKDLTADDLVEGLAYSITHDSENPNIVYLESKLGTNYTALWEHPQGRSQEKKVTLRIPFEGTYTVTFGVETRGGVIYGEPTTFVVKDFCAEFVTDELWTMLTGGVGNSKTWIYDNGSYDFLGGALSYGDPGGNPNFGWNSFTENWTPGMDHFSDANLLESSMTFDLIGAANYSYYNGTDGTTQTGLFSMNTSEYLLSTTNADVMHPSSWTERRADWRQDFKIIELDANHLRLGYKRLSGGWGGEWLEVFNFVSKEYADNYETPAVDVYPILENGWRDYVEPKTNKVITYKLSDDNPYDWCNLDGTLKGISSAAAPGIEDLILVMNSGTSEYTFTTPDGTGYTGKYSLSSDGIYTFTGTVPVLKLSSDGRAVFQTSTDQTLRIMQYELSDYSGGLTDLWLGSKEMDDQGKLYQYMGYHFVAQTGSSSEKFTANLNFFDTDWTFINGSNVYISGDGDYTVSIEGASSAPYGMYLDIMKILKKYPNMDVAIKDIKVDGNSISFDDVVIDRGVGDTETAARRYILNPWGATAADAPKYVFTSSIAITISVKMDNGTPFIKEAEE